MSPIIKPDLSDSKRNIEPGTYPAEIVTAETGTSGAGNPKVIVGFEVEAEGKKWARTSHLPYVGKGTFGFNNLLRATGFGDVAKQMEKDPSVEFDTDHLIGQRLFVVVEPDERYGDKIQNFLKM